MKDLRSYRQRGTPDLPIALYYVNPKRKKYLTVSRQPELSFLIVTEGQLECRLEETVYTVAAGEILVIPPERSRGLVSYSPDVCYYSMIVSVAAIAMPADHIFQQEFITPMQNGLLQMPALIQPGHPAYEEAKNVLAMLPECIMTAPNYKLKRYLAAVSLCVAIAPWCIHPDKSVRDPFPNNKIVRSAMLYIHNKYELPLDLKAIADHVHLHPNYLCALFKAHTGKTVLQYLAQKRVDAAIYLLQDSNLPVELIGEKSGFRSQNQFFRHFRQVTGTTPHAYRKQHRPESNRGVE